MPGWMFWVLVILLGVGLILGICLTVVVWKRAAPKRGEPILVLLCCIVSLASGFFLYSYFARWEARTTTWMQAVHVVLEAQLIAEMGGDPPDPPPPPPCLLC